jgi:hypothetical protein
MMGVMGGMTTTTSVCKHRAVGKQNADAYNCNEQNKKGSVARELVPYAHAVSLSASVVVAFAGIYHTLHTRSHCSNTHVFKYQFYLRCIIIKRYRTYVSARINPGKIVLSGSGSLPNTDRCWSHFLAAFRHRSDERNLPGSERVAREDRDREWLAPRFDVL